jgi:hypothetical protein
MPVRSYSGNAKSTALAEAITATATTFLVNDGTGYPDGAAGPFVVTLSGGTAGEEKVLCATRTGTSFTVAAGGRGFDDTTASAHPNQALVQHTFSATDAREANAHVNDAVGDPHPQYLTGAEADATYVNVTGGSTITAGGAGVIPLVVRGAASQTANLLEARDNAGTVLARIDAAGKVNASRGLVVVGRAGDNSIFLQHGEPAQTAVLVRGAASQSANLAEFQNSAGTVLVQVGPTGKVGSSEGFVISGRFDAQGAIPGGTNDTNVVLYSVPAAGLRRILVGGPDSAGTGFRTLRVLN